ncbi:hypothetical protein RYX36_006231 [Vicia faba]
MKTKRDDDCFEHLHFSPPSKSSRLDYYETTTTMDTDMDEDTPANVVPPLKQSDEEKSLVLYSNTPLLMSPTSPPLTIVVASHLIPGLKDYLLSQGTIKLDELGEDEMRREKTSKVSKDCLAVIPWVPNPLACKEIVPETCQTLEAEDSEMMDLDEPQASSSNEKKVEACGVSSPWQQQQCMMSNMLQPLFGAYFRGSIFWRKAELSAQVS